MDSAFDRAVASTALGLALVAACICAWSPAARADPTPTPARPRIAVVGASVSAGFVDGPWAGGEFGNATVPLQSVIEALYGDAQVGSHTSVWMFRDPVTTGTQQLQRVRSDPPDLVVALDFMFWFGYGSHRDLGRRLALQRQGLELLERTSATIVIGDYPDMSAAHPRMLPSYMRPSALHLVELNKHLRAWAKDRPNVIVFPLARAITALQGEGYTFEVRGCPSKKVGPEVLFQDDRLHPSRLGMLALGLELQPHLPRLAGRRSPVELARRLGLLEKLTGLLPAACRAAAAHLPAPAKVSR